MSRLLVERAVPKLGAVNRYRHYCLIVKDTNNEQRRSSCSLLYALAAMMADIQQGVLRAHWAAEEIALHLLATLSQQHRHLLLVLNAFGQRFHIKCIGEGGDRADDSPGAGAAVQIADETAVDLDLVERERA